MELFHTSPEAITTIHSTGRFGEFMFFSSSVYVMSAGETVTYKLDLDDDQIIEAGSIFYQEGSDSEAMQQLVAEVAARFDVDEDTAAELIGEEASLFDVCDDVDSDDSWDLQHFTARAARLLGFTAVVVEDEQGTAYMIDMTHKLADLEECSA